ncbi:RNA-binding S4 domain-containing protein [Saccharomonospora saliphila]|uniref:RNA-binding S4 domain-containing protein n=1 Tax=Saccharomonospora saliphila TaxID=369829 RepID=UPI00035D3391|nr:RNA-binding S4 domain-containing protein [Saccharomonospora saliphila]
MSTTRTVGITRAPIALGQFLKLAGLAEDGAQAKGLLASPGVTVNGAPEHRRGRQLADGDLVTVGEDTLQVRVT